MKKFFLNGVEFTDFGTNNYSHGMHLITAYPMPAQMVEDVLNNKYPGVYLDPSAPCGEEFFGLFGTEEQYTRLYEDQRKCQISCKMIPFLRLPQEEFEEKWAEFERTYKDWWQA